MNTLTARETMQDFKTKIDAIQSEIQRTQIRKKLSSNFWFNYAKKYVDVGERFCKEMEAFPTAETDELVDDGYALAVDVDVNVRRCIETAYFVKLLESTKGA